MKITRRQLRQLIQEEMAKESRDSSRHSMQMLLEYSASIPSSFADYHVQPGDTLNDIITNFVRKGFGKPEVFQVNPDMTDPDVIVAGDVIKLPIDIAPYQTVGDQLMTVDHPAVTRFRPEMHNKTYLEPHVGGGKIFSFFDPVSVEDENQAVDDFYRDQTGY